ncbi:MAG TPA: fasciclin domain-containing protein [Methanoregulaceae archaeon]|nr:fasciclin domain-containing protein [Methanoregulaceae archaeon]
MDIKKRFLLIIIAVTVFILLAGCTQPGTPPSSTETPAPTMAPPAANIVETAISDGRFTTLVAAVQAANLADTLISPGPFTVFAPTDDAFAALPEGTVESLLENPDGALTQILLYHVAPGELMASDVIAMSSIPTVQGNSIQVTVMDGKVMVDGATVIITDIETSNGVIHVIDAVILPPSNCYQTTSTSPEAPNHVHTWCEGANNTLELCTAAGVCHTHGINEEENLAKPGGLGNHTHTLT